MAENQQLEKNLRLAAGKLRSNLNAAGYKRVVLGFIFLKYISDAFEELYDRLKAEEAETGTDPEDKGEYTAGAYLLCSTAELKSCYLII